MITYQVESWPDYFNDPDREALWQEHYDEFLPAHEAKMPFGPDVETYHALDRAGILLVFTARRDGKLIGYCLMVIRRHIHYPTVCGFEDSYFLTAGARQGMTGYKLITRTISECKARGCSRVYFMTKEFNTIAILLERMGMKRIDSVYAMWLED